MIELIMVLVIVGILSAVVAPKIFDNTFNMRGFHDETLALLRYAQKTAIAQRRTVCVSITQTSAALTIASAAPPSIICDTNLIAPNGTLLTYTVTAKSEINYTAVPTDFNFNALGQPITTVGQPSLTQTLQVSGIAPTITIEAETGYIHE